jgi:hypothetical protein
MANVSAIDARADEIGHLLGVGNVDQNPSCQRRLDFRVDRPPTANGSRANTVKSRRLSPDERGRPRNPKSLRRADACPCTALSTCLRHMSSGRSSPCGAQPAISTQVVNESISVFLRKLQLYTREGLRLRAHPNVIPSQRSGRHVVARCELMAPGRNIRRHDEARYAVGNSRQVVVQRAYNFPSGSSMRPSAIAVLLPL